MHRKTHTKDVKTQRCSSKYSSPPLEWSLGGCDITENYRKVPKTYRELNRKYGMGSGFGYEFYTVDGYGLGFELGLVFG